MNNFFPLSSLEISSPAPSRNTLPHSKSRSGCYLLYLCLFARSEHRPSTKERHCFLSVAIFSISFQVYPISFVSFSVSLCQVFRGLPLLLSSRSGCTSTKRRRSSTCMAISSVVRMSCCEKSSAVANYLQISNAVQWKDMFKS